LEAQQRGADSVSITSSSGGRPSPPGLIAIKQSSVNKGKGGPRVNSVTDSTGQTLIDPSSFLMPVLESGRDDDQDQEYDDDGLNLDIKGEDDDDDDDELDEGGYSIGYYPHAASLLVKTL